MVNRPEVLQEKGPLLLACNHPNSFLDGMILATLFQQPVYALARGDAFRLRGMNRFLRKLRLLPIYRTSEGTENLGHNYTTFDACREVFKQDGIVVIFSEGRCENEWHLRPLKKGTARLALGSWEQGIPLKVVPVALNYSSFESFGKDVHIYFGSPLDQNAIMSQHPEGKKMLRFNHELRGQLSDMVYEIDASDKKRLREIFSIDKKWLTYLLIPAIMGWILHAPLFYAVKLIAFRFRGSGHYDSVTTSLLLVLYPFYWIMMIIPGCIFCGWWGILLLMLPLAAKAAVYVKRVLNW